MKADLTTGLTFCCLISFILCRKLCSLGVKAVSVLMQFLNLIHNNLKKVLNFKVFADLFCSSLLRAFMFCFF